MPVTSALLIAVVMLVLSWVEGVEQMMSIDIWAMLGLAFGGWVGYKAVDMAGVYAKSFWQGIAIGVVWAVLIVLGWGVLKGAGIDAVWALAVFVFGMNVAGSLIGGGWAMK